MIVLAVRRDICDVFFGSDEGESGEHTVGTSRGCNHVGSDSDAGGNGDDVVASI